MTSRERVVLALEHREPDRVPLDLGGSLVTSIAIPAYSALRRRLGLAERAVTALAETDGVAAVDTDCIDRLGLDVVPLFPSPPDRAPLAWENEQGRWLRDSFGATLHEPRGACGFDYVGAPFAGEAVSLPDLERIAWDDLADPGFFRGVRERALRLQSETGCALFGMAPHGHDLLNRWFRIRGMMPGLVDLLERPDVVDGFLERFASSICRNQELFLEQVGDLIDVQFLADDLGTQSSLLASPGLLREMVLPRWARIVKTVRAHTRAKVFFHSCGAVAPLIPDFIDMGVEVLNPVQVTCPGMDTAALKRRYGRRLTFWGGGVDTQTVLSSRSPDEVRAEVRRRVADLAPGGGFVFTPVHNILPHVPVDNIIAAYDEAQRAGRYPRR